MTGGTGDDTSMPAVECVTTTTKTTTDSGDKSAMPGTGSWKELKDTVNEVGNPRPSVNGVDLEGRHGAGAGVDVEAPRERPRIGADALIHESRHVQTDGVFYKVYKRRWFGVIQLTLLNIVVSWDWLTFAPVSSHAATYFATSENAINWLSIAFLFSFPAIALVVIYVLHWGPRPAIMAASVLILAGNWLRYGGTRAGSGSGNFGLVMFGQILTGLAQPFVLAAPTRYSDLWFTNRGRVAATALMSLANPFGAALGQLIIPFWVAGPGDIPNMVLYVSIIASIASVPGFFIPAAPPTPVAPSSQTPKTSLKASIRVLAASPEFWMLSILFSVYVGFFNSISSLLNQIMAPHGYTDDEAGIAGAVLIVVGLVASAVSSPIIDRTKGFVASIKILVPIISLCYLVFIWMPGTQPTGGLAGPYVILAILGASSFSLLPVAVELLVEVTHPVSPEVTSTLSWSGGQVLGACFILISDAIKAGPDASPPYNMFNALIFQAVIALAVAPMSLLLGLFGRSDKVSLRRVASDRLASEARASEQSAR